MLVESVADGKSFAKPGDSGALVWSTNGTPIGLVSYQLDDYILGKKRTNVTYVVRLDRCLQALEESGGQIQHLTCQMHGCPVPYPRSLPKDDLHVDDVENLDKK